MNTVKCLIIDDEPIAVQVVRNYLDKLEAFEITAICSNALDAFDYLQSNRVDLIFLDIQMPKMSGLEFLRTLRNPPKVILVTAYREYAYEGFEMDVVDYLLKPVSFERFLKAIGKYNSIVDEGAQLRTRSGSTGISSEEFIWIRADRKNIRVNVDDIQYVEGLRDYVKIYLSDKMLISKIPIKGLERILPVGRFIRIHRSYLVSVSKIAAFNHEGIDIGPVTLPIGKNFRESVLAFLEKGS